MIYITNAPVTIIAVLRINYNSETHYLVVQHQELYTVKVLLINSMICKIKTLIFYGYMQKTFREALILYGM